MSDSKSSSDKKEQYQLTPVQSTSLLVCYWRASESLGDNVQHIEEHTPLIQDPPAQALLEALLSPQQRQDYEQSPIRPYGIECLATRTKALDDWLMPVRQQEQQQQRRQLVNLGAGFCCRPYRLKELSDHVHSCWEVDFDLDLLKVKRSVLQSAGYQPQLPIFDVSMDLSCLKTSLAQTLQQHGFVLHDNDSNENATPTDWIAEGLLAYLTPPQHSKLFQETAALSAKGSRMAMTVAEPEMAEFWETFGVQLPYSDLVPIEQILIQAKSFGWTVDNHIQPHDWSRLYPGRGEQLPGYHVVFLIKE